MLITNASKEYLTAIRLHEIYHAYLYAQGTIKTTLAQHLDMAQNYIDAQVNLLVQMYPNLGNTVNGVTNYDTLCLMVSGFGQVAEDFPDAYNAILSRYSLTDSDVSSISTAYKSGAAGTNCN